MRFPRRPSRLRPSFLVREFPDSWPIGESTSPGKTPNLPQWHFQYRLHRGRFHPRNTSQDHAARRVLQNWWQASAHARPLPAQLAELTSRLIGAVTSVAPNANWRFGRILKELWLTGVIAAIAAVLCGLRFQLVAYLFSTPATRVVSAAFVHSPGAGWYVVCVAVVLRGPALVPFLRYKDKSFVAHQHWEYLRRLHQTLHLRLEVRERDSTCALA